MKSAGRKPKPSNVHKLHGNPGRRKRNQREPKPEVVVPDPPAHLEGDALEEWDRVVPELRALGLISAIDRNSLAAYCQAYARWVEAEAKLKQYGQIVKSPAGYPMQSPYLGIANTALKFMRDFATEFGMTPSSRSRVSTAGKPPQSNLMRFLENG